MKRTAIGLLMVFLSSAYGCGKAEAAELDESTMANICELASMDAFYHNTAKFNDTETQWFVFKKPVDFWMEYSGVVTFGVDGSKVTFSIDPKNNVVTISMPKATLQGVKVDHSSLSEESYYVANGSVSPNASYEKEAFAEAQKAMNEIAKKDEATKNQATKFAQDMLRQYVEDFGQASGIDYTIEFNIIS